MKRFCFLPLAFRAALALPIIADAQVNSGSNGSDGALNPTSNLVIDMADHPDGIYQYTTVNIPAGVMVSFIPNAGDKPVVWLVQSDCVVAGTLDLSGKNEVSGMGGLAGPGGFRGGNGGTAATSGQGPGGGARADSYLAGSASYSTLGKNDNGLTDGAGPLYGNNFLLPLMGGSGGGGTLDGPAAGGGGGGALLLAVSGETQLTGYIISKGGIGTFPGVPGSVNTNYGGHGSGGAVRVITTRLRGTGTIDTTGGQHPSWQAGIGGSGRVRFDTTDNNFGGMVRGTFTQGFQPIIIPAPGQGVQLAIQSIAGNAVPTNPSGVLANPDVIISAQQTNPVPVVVKCTNVALNSEISVVVHPANGPDVQAVALNNSGSTASSTATVVLNVPRGGGIIYAKTVTGINGGASTAARKDSKALSFAETGLTADGERFAQVETKATAGGKQETTLITESGKRFPLPK